MVHGASDFCRRSKTIKWMPYSKILSPIIDLCDYLCEFLCMATNIEIDNTLVTKAMKLGGIRTKREAVNKALAEYVQRREQLGVLDLFGTVDYDPDYDYKAQRARK